MEGSFLIAACALIVNSQNEVLITQRSFSREHHPGKWETQSGRLKQGESVIEGLKREMKEELSIEIEPIIPLNTFHFFRGEGKVEHIGVTYLCRIKSGDIKVDGIEEVAYKWVRLEEALKIIEDGSVAQDIKLLQELLRRGLKI